MIYREGSAIVWVETSATCRIFPVIASLKPHSRLSYKGLKRLSDRFDIQVQAIQSLCKVRQFLLQSPFRRGFGPFSGGGPDEGERSCGSLGGSSSCGHYILRLLGINILEHGHDYIQVVMSIQGAIQLCGYGGFEQVKN